ncbi:Retrovirus-related Pol polyprotein from transposon TNT 1-94 [Cucumis melo var. makuwa]|uniref:Retrovirus-related Pol polyprotein from transposon TNT 1-94 n=1 Tax=Cucumis melo var. makuwa TaxID=1194695 RepID=A0A5D3DDF2_CUCMM|nr:Retrovirus-related Pol polyprotein from transposon TNT 1-94 [Cucumis melo var. makuwa]
MLSGYDITQDTMILYCDNMSALNISKNPVPHSRTKHIDIRNHFNRNPAPKPKGYKMIPTRNRSKGCFRVSIQSSAATGTIDNLLRVSRFSSKRKAMVHVSDSESVDTIAIDLESSDDDNVVLLNV